MQRGAVLGVVLILQCALVGGCVTTKSMPAPSRGDAAPVFAPDYRVSIADSLRIDVYGHEDLSVTVPVRPDGRITVPVAGDVVVGGKTPEEVSRSIASTLSEYVRDPIVTTTVVSVGGDEFLSRVRVTGQVQSPTSLPYRNGMTVLDAILECGGPNEFARLGNAVLNRASGERLAVRVDRLLKGADMRTNYLLQPGDVLTIPMALF